MKKSTLETYVRMYGMLRYIMQKNENGYHPRMEEIQRHCRSYELGREVVMHRNTLHRYMDNLRGIAGVKLECDRNYGYYVSNCESLIRKNGDLFYWLDMMWLQAVTRHKGRLHDTVSFEPLPEGVRFVPEILLAIWNRHPLEIQYLKLDDDTPKTYHVHPLGLRQYLNRFYLAALFPEEGTIKTLAFHSMQAVDVDYNVKFAPQKFSIHEYYEFYYGVWTDVKRSPVDIRLRAKTQYWKNFIKNPPFHHTLKMINTSPDGKWTDFIIHVVPMPDLAQKLYGLSPGILVMEPPILKDYMIRRLRMTLDAYASPDAPLPELRFPDRF